MLTNFRKKQKGDGKNHILLKVGVVLILCISVALIFINIRMFQRRVQLNRQIDDLKTKIENLKNSNVNLKEGIEKSDDVNYMEKVVGEELDLQKPGEKVFSFVKAPSQEQEAVGGKNIWQAWLGWIGEWFKK